MASLELSEIWLPPDGQWAIMAVWDYDAPPLTSAHWSMSLMEVESDLVTQATALSPAILFDRDYYVAAKYEIPTRWFFPLYGRSVGDVVYLKLFEPSGGSVTESITLAGPADLDEAFTYGVPDVAATTIRYTTLDRVKARLNISGTDWDTELTAAIISAEIALDLNLGRSFPDTGTNPRYPFVPVPIAQAATNVAVAVAKATDAPFGQSSSADLYGELEVADVVRREIQRSPILVGFRVRSGFSGYGRLPT